MMSSSSVNFTQGPRFKGEATVQFENLIKDILHGALEVSYNQLNELVITANGRFYNLTQLLKHQPDFEQLNFSSDDVAAYDAFLRSPQAYYQHTSKQHSEEQLARIKNAFPSLSEAEMSAIYFYTEDFFTTIDRLLITHAENVAQEKLIFHSGFVGHLYPGQQQHEDDYLHYLKDPVYLNALIKEVLLAASFIAFGLSKPTQAEIKVSVAASEGQINANIDKLKGVSLVLIPASESNKNRFQLCIVAYGKIINWLKNEGQLVTIDMKELLNSRTKKGDDGIVVSLAEQQIILAACNLPGDFNSLKMLSDDLMVKLSGILTSIKGCNELFYEEVFNVDSYLNPMYQLDNEQFVAEVEHNLNTPKSFQFSKTFFSTSKETLYDFGEADGSNIITKIVNPVLLAKNIESLSMVPDEQERLIIFGQQIAYTSVSSKISEVGGTEHDLSGELIRSIDGIDPFSYSHTAMLQREQGIGKTLTTKALSRKAEDANVDVAQSEPSRYLLASSILLFAAAVLAGFFVATVPLLAPILFVAGIIMFAAANSDLIDLITEQSKTNSMTVNTQMAKTLGVSHDSRNVVSALAEVAPATPSSCPLVPIYKPVKSTMQAQLDTSSNRTPGISRGRF